MPARPALLRLVAAASDQIVHDFLSAQGFAPAPAPGGPTIRRYVAQREFRDIDIEIFRDAAWDGEGGTVRIRMRSLVHPVQQVIGGAPQSLVSPRADAPLSHFELGPHADNLPGSWPVHGPTDVGLFAEGLLAYLRDVAIPWLSNTESMDAVLAHLASLDRHAERERLSRAWGKS